MWNPKLYSLRVDITPQREALLSTTIRISRPNHANFTTCQRRARKGNRMARIQFELTDEQLVELEKLMTESGTKTKKDLLNNALTLLEWALNEKKNGRIIASVNEKENKYKELVMPILASVAA